MSLDTDELLRDALERSQSLVAIVDGDTPVLVSDGLRRLLGDRASVRSALTNLVASATATARAGRSYVESPVQDAQGNDRHLAFELTSLSGTPGSRVLLIGLDVTDRFLREIELSRRATTDPLTGLPNGALLADRLGQAILTAEREGTSAALIVMDLDDFKRVNDTFGHRAGDALLRDVGERTRQQLRESDTVARIGGDEFAILLPPPGDIVSALTTARKVREALNRQGGVAPTGRSDASLGIALFPQHARTAELLLEHADAAMYAARRTGRGVAVYDPEHDMRAALILSELEEIGHAIEDGQLDLDYQPTIRLSDRRPMRAEALVRWMHASRGRLRPAAFLPLAERGGYGSALNAWVLRTALERCREWRVGGIQAGVSVNVGLRDLLDFDLAGRVRTGLESTGLEPRVLTLEIGERVLTQDPARLQRPLLALAKIGVRLAVDDFGTGPASLRLLQRLPISEIKLDPRFVSEVCTNIDSWSFVRSGIDAAHDLGLEVTAEGVEDKATAYVLERLGCDVAQGAYFTKSPSAIEPGFLRTSELDNSPLN